MAGGEAFQHTSITMARSPEVLARPVASERSVMPERGRGRRTGAIILSTELSRLTATEKTRRRNGSQLSGKTFLRPGSLGDGTGTLSADGVGQTPDHPAALRVTAFVRQQLNSKPFCALLASNQAALLFAMALSRAGGC